MSTLSLQLRGWTLTDDPDPIVRELLGEAVESRTLERPAAGWRNEDPQPPEHPVGPLRSLVGVACLDAAEVLFVPGSQGQDPPPQDAGHAIVQVEVQAGNTLLLDGRCWYERPDRTGISVRLWSARPGARS